MTASQKRKWLHAFIVSGAASLGDLGTQLMEGKYAHPGQTVIVGIVVFVVTRLAGAAVAAWATSNSDPPSQPPPSQPPSVK